MKKLIVLSAGLLFTTLFFSCKENVCIKCTTIQNGDDPQELCSRNRDERQKFQTDWIKSGYNCTVVE